MNVAPAALVAAIPSPPASGLSIGSLRLHVYGLLIALGIAAAVWIAQRRWERIGGQPRTMSALAVWGVPGGLIGARAYSVVTSYQADTGGHWTRIFEIWRGGLGVWGAVVGGVFAGLLGARRMGLPMRPLLDCVAFAFPLGQAVGRWGNYFNQELFGRPTGLPWAVKIDVAQRPAQYIHQATFQPTFLYESAWDLAIVGILWWAAGRFAIRRGYLFAVYAALYTFGRFGIEYLRVDQAHRFLGLRLNGWVSVLVFAGAVILLVTRGRPRAGDELVSDPLPTGGSGKVASGAGEPVPGGRS